MNAHFILYVADQTKATNLIEAIRPAAELNR
jgi:hypothetical protein